MFRWKGFLSAFALLVLLPLTTSAQYFKILDAQPDLDPRFPIYNPISTWWHELWPQPSNVYHLSSWYDNNDGYLSRSDIIDITAADGTISWWHVERVTITIWLTQKGTGDWWIADLINYDQGYDYLRYVMHNPISSYWEWLPPRYGKFHLSSWDDNGDYYLSPSDQIDITDEWGRVTWWHVDRVTTNIYITPEPGSIAALGVGLVGFIALRRRRK